MSKGLSSEKRGDAMAQGTNAVLQGAMETHRWLYRIGSA
jgi:hypothetical protein